MAMNDPNVNNVLRDAWSSAMLDKVLRERSPLLEMFPPAPRAPLTRVQRLKARLHRGRERVALRIAPWLEDQDWYG